VEAVLVGRPGEASVLAAAARDVGGGSGRVLWLDGEVGIGKSALIDFLVERAGQAKLTVLRAVADEAVEAFPLRLAADSLRTSPAAGAVAGLREEINKLLDGTGEHAEVLDPVLAASERFLELVDRLCAANPVLLVLEDLQWADQPSLLTWRRLATAAAQLPLLLVGTAGPAPHRAEVVRLRDAVAGGLGTVLAVGPLSGDSALELFTRHLPGTPGPLLRRQLDRAGGNPLYIQELASALVRDGLIEQSDGTAELRGNIPGLPESLSATIKRRLGFLGPDTRGVLRMAALLGTEFDVHQIALVLGRSAASMAGSLEEAHAAGVLAETDGGRIAFRHGLIRQALVDELSASLRTALHRQFAQSLARYGAGLDAVATHLLAAPGTVEPWLARWLADQPESALFTAPEVAAELLGQIVEAREVAGERWEELAARLASVYSVLGRDSQAERLAREVLRTSTDPGRRAQMWLHRVRSLSRRGELDTALAVTGDALADPSLQPAQRARIRARSAIVLIKDDRQAESRQQAELALREGEGAGDTVAIGYARHALSHLDTAPATALAQVEAALRDLTTGDPESTSLRFMLLNNRLAHLNNLGRRDDFEAAAREMLILAGRIGAARTAGTLFAAAMGCYDFGSWDDAIVHLDLMPAESPAPPRLGRYGLAALIAAHREDWAALRAHVEQGERVPVAGGDARIYSGYLLAAQAMRAEADGDRGRAVEILASWLAPGAETDRRERYMWLPTLIRLALSTQDTGTVAAAVAAATLDASRYGALPMQVAAAELGRAQQADDVPALLRVAEAYRRHGWPLLQALSYEEAAVRQARQGSVEPARAALNDAARGYAALGATWDLRRVDSRLRVYGMRRGSRSLSQRPATGWESLTAAERRVAELVSLGRSNPDIAAELFLSRRTVQTHVSRILGKLQLRSRMEIIRESAARS
jgi:DNA-binding CsgD family transcriptional regulator